MAHGLKLVTLGGLSITSDATPVTGLASRKAEALLVYLACTQRPHAREVLADLLWDDVSQERARGNLSVLLTSLRQKLGPYLRINRQTVQLNTETHVWVDVLELEKAVAAVSDARAPLSLDAAEELRESLQLYRGDFLQGFSLRDSAGFEVWMREEQERLRRLVVGAGYTLVSTYLQAQEYGPALTQATNVLRLEPFDEDLHRQIMLLLAYSGQRGAAISHYGTCRQLLEAELGVEPADETTALYRQILAGDLAAPSSRTTPKPTSPPPAKSIAVLGQPFQPLPFIGRDVELAQIRQRLIDPDCRLLTLLGPGGIGKTRLALQIAMQQAPTMTDGAAFVGLASVQEVQNVSSAIATTLGCPITGQSEPTAQLLAFLRPKQMLLVLDNFEHLLESADLLNDILASAPQVKLLVTSRERLQLRAEWLIDVFGLTYPQDQTFRALPVDAVLERYSAVQLFLQHAQRVQTDFKLTAEHYEAVIRICQLVEGMPLALELAGALLRTYSTAEIAQEIGRTVDVLTTKLRDVPTRHRSLRAVFDYSWKLLTPQEQRILCQCAVFRGGWASSAAERVILGQRDLLAALIDKSLVRYGTSNRNDLHELVRQFVTEQLTQLQQEGDTDVAKVGERHSDWYLALVAAHETALIGRTTADAANELRQDIDNIRGAWTFAVEHVRLAGLRDAAIGLARFYDASGLFAEGEAVFESAAECVRNAVTLEAADNYQGQHVLCILLVEHAHFLSRRARYDQAIQVIEQASARALTLDDQQLEANIRLVWGETLWHQAQYTASLQQLAQALAHARAAGLRDVEAECLLNLGVVAESNGDYAAMRTYQTAALTLYEDLGNLRGMGLALNNLAGVAYHLGNYGEAQTYLQRALQVCQETGDRYNESRVLNNLGEISTFQGSFSQAQAYLDQALLIKREIGDRRGESFTLNNIGDLARHQGDYAAARGAYEQALRIRCDIGYRLGEAQILAAQALLAHELDERQAAHSLSEQALSLAREVGAKSLEGTALTNLGHALLALHLTDEADLAYKQALHLRETLGQSVHQMEVHAGLARVALRREAIQDAVTHCETILSHLQTNHLQGTTEPFRIYLTCYQVLSACGDQRAHGVLKDAQQLLATQASTIVDDQQRALFLQGVPAHRTLTLEMP